MSPPEKGDPFFKKSVGKHADLVVHDNGDNVNDPEYFARDEGAKCKDGTDESHVLFTLDEFENSVKTAYETSGEDCEKDSCPSGEVLVKFDD